MTIVAGGLGTAVVRRPSPAPASRPAESDREKGGSPVTVSEDFAQQTLPYRRELLAHCYQMLGSVHDAEDLVQETLLRAWRSFDRYDDQRASIRTWLHRIATNACLTALEGRRRRPLPSGLGAPGDDPTAPLVPSLEVPWLEPMPDALVDPASVVVARGQLRLALVAAMQHLPARQRAILIMREVLEWSAAEAADALGTTPAAVNSGLQRARARLEDLGIGADHVTEPVSAEQRGVVERYVAAFVDGNLAAVGRLLAEDVVLEMPPVLAWYRGPEHVVGFLADVFRRRGADWQMVPIGSNGQPALAAYVRDGATYRIHSIQVFSATEHAITRSVVFTDPAVVAAFAVPAELVRSG